MTEENKPLWTVAFPDFPAADMPEMIAGFEDTSYKNDTCPSFYDEELSLLLFVDRADPAAREVKGAKRFSIHKQVDPSDNPQEILSTDDWREILTAVKIRCTEYEREIGRA